MTTVTSPDGTFCFLDLSDSVTPVRIPGPLAGWLVEPSTVGCGAEPGQSGEARAALARQPGKTSATGPGREG